MSVSCLHSAAGQKRKRAEDQAAAAVGLKRSNVTPTSEGQADPPDGVPQASAQQTAAASDVSLPCVCINEFLYMNQGTFLGTSIHSCKLALPHGSAIVSEHNFSDVPAC